MSTTPEELTIDQVIAQLTEEEIKNIQNLAKALKKNRFKNFVKDHAVVIGCTVVLASVFAYAYKQYDPEVYSDMPDFNQE